MSERIRTVFAAILWFTAATSSLHAPAIATAKAVRPWLIAQKGTSSTDTPRTMLSNPHSSGVLLPLANAGLFGLAQASAQEKSIEGDLNLLPGQTSTLLPDGRLLLLGGQKGNTAVATAFIKDSSNGITAQLSAAMQQPRYGHTATVLPDGRVLVLGGIGGGGQVIAGAEIYDLRTSTFAAVSIPGLTPRVFSTATLITDGRIVVAGGVSAEGKVVGTIELLDSRTFTISKSNTALLTPRHAHTAALQADGTVLFWGGVDANGSRLEFGESFDPVSQHLQLQATPLPVDSTLSLVASIPEDGNQNVSLNPVVGLRFSRRLRVTSVNSNTVTLTGPDGNSGGANIIPAEAGMLAFVTPQRNLLPATGYELTISGASDLSGTVLPDSTITFVTTGSNSKVTAGFGTSDKQQNSPFESQWRRLPPLMAPLGVTAVSGQVLELNGEPLTNTTLEIRNLSAQTDRTGRFLLAKIPDGHQVMWIDGTTANRRGAVYGVYKDGIDIKAKQTNILPYTIWMAALDMAHAGTIPSPTTKETIVSTPLLPGLELHLPAGVVIKDRNGTVVTRVSITPIPIAQPPFPLPKGVKVPLYFTIQPGGAYLERYGHPGSGKAIGARLFYPNSTHLPPGTLFDFWNYDANHRGWYVYGQGFVAADGKQVVPNPGVVIYEFTGAMVGNPPTPTTGPLPGNPTGGEPVDLQTGLFVYSKTDLYLPDLIPIQVTHTYRQLDPTSRAFGVGTMSNYDIYLTGDSLPNTFMDLIMPNGGRVHFVNISSGGPLGNQLLVHVGSPSAFYGATIVWNGNGWTLTMKNGTKLIFPDSFLANSFTQAALIGIVDRNGNSLAFTRDSNHNLTQISSPNGRWIQYTYDSSNRVVQATDNTGRSVFYTYDSSGRLSTVKDANGGITTFTYDSQANMQTIQDARGIVYLTNHYNGNGMVDQQTLVGGGTYLFNYVTSSCGSGAGSLTNAEADVTDPNGNVRKVTFNCDGYMTSQTSAFGKPEQQAFTYNRQQGSGLILSTTDALNRQTSFTYDSLGNVTSGPGLPDQQIPPQQPMATRRNLPK